MTRLNLEIFDDVISTLNKIQNINDEGIELVIPEGAILFDNVLNLKLIKKRAEALGAIVHFVTDDQNGINLIEMVEEGNAKFTPSEESQNYAEETLSASIPKINLNFSFNKIMPKLPKLKFKFGLNKAVLLPIIVALAFVAIYHFSQTTRKASAKLIINSQPLARSITVKIKAGTPTNVQNKILAGTTVRNSLEVTKEIETTGTKLVGTKATGVATIYNKTTDEKEFKKGTVLIYDDGDKDLNFITKDTVTVPAAEPQDPADPASPLTPGSIDVDIEAELVGASYNIDKEKALSVKSYKKTTFAAETKDKTTGGKSESKKIVADADILKLQNELAAEAVKQSTDAISKKIANSQALLAQSIKSSVSKDTITAKAGDEKDKISGTRYVEIEGLTYLKSEMDKFLDDLLKEYVPQGFVLSSKERQTTIDVLGNSTKSVLNSEEADVQATLKTYVVPDITEDSVKKLLAGKTASEAQKTLAGIQNVKTYEFHLSKGFIPIFNSVPKDLAQISVEIVRN